MLPETHTAPMEIPSGPLVFCRLKRTNPYSSLNRGLFDMTLRCTLTGVPETVW